MPALVSFASVLRRSRYRLDISNPVSLLRRVLCPHQPPKLIVKERVVKPLESILSHSPLTSFWLLSEPYPNGRLALSAFYLSSLLTSCGLAWRSSSWDLR